jgi:transcriptional regulator with XRE-family HTH domain
MTSTVTPTGSRVPTFDTLAERLWWSRASAGLTQQQLADQLGISKRTVVNYESGAQSPKHARLVLWANACDVDAAWLVGQAARLGPDNAPGTGRVNRRYATLLAA